MKLRVCHMIAGDQWAGAEAQMAHLLWGLAQYEELDLSAVLLAEGCLAEELRQAGVFVTVVNEEKLGRLRMLRDIAKALGQRKVAIVHTHGYKTNILGYLAGRSAGVRWFVKTMHGQKEPWQGIDRLKMSFYMGLDYLGNWLATDRVIAVSSDLYADLVARLPARRVELIRNGVDPAKIKPTMPRTVLRRQMGVTEDTPIFGTAGRLMPVKGLDYFLQSAQGILSKLPESRFLIVGEGPLKSQLEKRVRELGLESAVNLLGFRRDIIDVLNLMDVFVMPSLHEGLPIVLLEAMALGKPIVASRVGGIPEALHDPLGWLVPPRDVRALQEACVEAYVIVRKGLHTSTVQERTEDIRRLASNMVQQTRTLYQGLARQTED